jgi:hypothetical protein
MNMNGNWVVTVIELKQGSLAASTFTHADGVDALVAHIEGATGPIMTVDGEIKELEITVETKKVVTNIKVKGEK